MDKRNHERVTVTLELPVEVAEFLVRDGNLTRTFKPREGGK